MATRRVRRCTGDEANEEEQRMEGVGDEGGRWSVSSKFSPEMLDRVSRERVRRR